MSLDGPSSHLRRVLVQGIFAKIGPDLELRWGDLISSPVDSIVSLVSPKKLRTQLCGEKLFFGHALFTFSQKCNRWP